MQKLKYTFGPVSSRRFGLSLGIDLSPIKKQCNFDCLYCELNRAEVTNKFYDSVDLDELISQVEEELRLNNKIEVITVTSNGEPTLYPLLDLLITRLNKIKKDKKTLILSNASLIDKKYIQNSLLKFDMVKLSFDCSNQNCLKKLDRNHKSINIDNIINGLIEFSRIYHNIIIEILFVKDINDDIDNIKNLITIIKQIKPARVDIGTIDRPPAYNVKKVDFDFLDNVAKEFVKNGIINVSIAHVDMKKPQNLIYSENDIIELLKMRPLTNSDIEYLFDKNSKEIFLSLLKLNKIKQVKIYNNIFYKAN